MHHLKNRAGAFIAACALLFLATAANAQSATDIAGVITAVDGYRTAAIVVAIAILLFVIGRTVVRKLVK